MTIILSVLLLFVWLFLVIKGADYLVDGASSLAFKFGISALVVWLTVVSFGTSAPELVVSLMSAVKWSTQASLGNVIWSNLFNTLMILGVTAFFAPLKVQSSTVRKEIPFSLLAGLSVLLLGSATVINNGTFFSVPWNEITIIGELGISQWLILLCFFGIFMYYVFGLTKGVNEPSESQESEVLSTGKTRLYMIWWLVALVFWWDLAVKHAVSLATMVGLSEKVIGLTILSVGTSLPELVTSIKAARKWQSDIAIGNAIGSNIFNVFWILGIVALVRPISLNGSNIMDIIALIAVTILVFILLFINRKFHIEKFEGAVMIAIYISYITYLIIS